MRIVLGVPVYNDSIFIDRSIQNALDVGYDDVVYLDDCSTDNSYEKLLEYSKKYRHIHVFSNQCNTVSSGLGNKWKIVSDLCRKFNPDWIMVRAADECLSWPSFKRGQNLLSLYLESLENFTTVSFPYVNLWRSEWWFREDVRSGTSLDYSINESCWKNDSGWDFVDKSGVHLGLHKPNVYKNRKYKCTNINLDFKNRRISSIPLIVILHYGMSSHELIERKLKYYIDIKREVGTRANMPSGIPHPKDWGTSNGFKVGYENGIILTKAHQEWFETPIPNVPKPEIKSLAKLIEQYDKGAAEAYRQFYKGKVIE
jgi:glycosyltransferase involved in cell wall biosynthesis